MGTDKDRRRVQALLKRERQGWRMQRLIALKLGFDSSRSDAQIVAAVGRSKATLHRWFALYRQGGLDAVLRRDYQGRQSK